jgi:hypothetical protein
MIPLLSVQVTKRKKDQKKFVFALISPELHPQMKKLKEDQERLLCSFISLVLLSHLRWAQQHRQQNPIQKFTLTLSIPTAVALGTQKGVPFVWSLLRSKRSGHQKIVTTYSVWAVSKNGQCM